MTAAMAMIGLAASCWVMRALFIVMVPAARLPVVVRDALGHLAPAVLSALVATELVGAAQGLDLVRLAVLLGAVVLAGAAARVTGRGDLAIAVGLAAAVLIDVVLV